MSVAAIRPYSFDLMDTVEKFPAPILYVGWEDHLMFCAPFCLLFPPTMKFGDMVNGAFPGVFGAHPDFAKIDWSKVAWTKSGKPFEPDFEKSLAENGLRHKDVIRFVTPGLRGIAGSCS